MSFLSPASPQVASGGRNKIALKPGHSLMDWVRFKNKLIPDRPRRITLSELAEHNRVGDVWTAIHGAVYDITAYVDYHPGGVDELMKGAGIDSTELFNQIHKWVNFQSMLKECLVGYLVTEAVKVKPCRKTTTSLTVPTVVTIPEVSFSWDTYQSERTYTLIVYARVPFSNKIRQSHYYGFIGTSEMKIVACCNNKQYHVHVRYHQPCSRVEIRHHNLKFELCLFKQEEKLWPSEGEHLEKSKTTSTSVTLLPFTATVSDTQKLNHDCSLITLSYDGGFVANPPLGSHVYVHLADQPVDRKPYTVFSVPDRNSFQLMVKRYPDSTYSAYLTDLVPGDSVTLSGFDGHTDMDRLRNHTEIVILAAGTGITPFNRILGELRKSSHFSAHHCTLFFYNKTKADRVWADELEKDAGGGGGRVEVRHVLSQEKGEWEGLRGRVNVAHFEDKVKDALFLVCGPVGFMEQAERILKENAVPSERVIEFKG